jgi:DNA-binding winged helix-turn-helix (wHTH) protein/TolB-like protein/Tfp pilus assembly protein PilF
MNGSSFASEPRMTSEMTEASTVTRRDDSGQVARFGVFELDLRNAELRRDGLRVKLQEQPFRLLAFLVQRAGEIVTREELQQALWPSDFVEFDQGLNAAVRKLRTALDDSADNPRFVETLARRGYRFIAPVEWLSRHAERSEASRRRDPSASARLRMTWVAAVIALAAIGAVFIFRGRFTTRPSIDTVAVLPFTIDEKQNEHLSDGLTEMLIDNLSRLPNLRVMARTTVFQYKNQPDVRRAANDLRVNAIVTGTVRRERDRYAIRVELIDARDWTQIWGDRFDGAASDLPSLQNQISEELSMRLRRGVERRAIASANSRAYDEYMRGLYAWNKRGRTDLQNALQHFNRAAELDPAFPGAYAGVANVYGVMVGYGWISPAEGAPKVLAAARRALDLDPDNAEALTSIASTKYRNFWDFAGADRDYRHAIASNPNYATAHQWYADLLRSMGRLTEARRENEIAYRLDPFAMSTNAMMCFAYIYERKYDEAIAFSRKAAEGEAQIFLPNCRIKAFISKGDFDSAAAEVRKLPLGHEEFPDAIALPRTIDPATMRLVWLEAMLKRRDAETRSPMEIAEVYAALGDRDRAFAWLDKACKHRVSRLMNVNIDPGFDPLRGDPRYDDLLRRIGLPKLPIAGS